MASNGSTFPLNEKLLVIGCILEGSVGDLAECVWAKRLVGETTGFFFEDTRAWFPHAKSTNHYITTLTK